MRIFPVINAHRNFVNKSKHLSANTENNKNQITQNKNQSHKYTGVASTDLAYASMFDSAIARDLKLMGLI